MGVRGLPASRNMHKSWMKALCAVTQSLLSRIRWWAHQASSGGCPQSGGMFSVSRAAQQGLGMGRRVSVHGRITWAELLLAQHQHLRALARTLCRAHARCRAVDSKQPLCSWCRLAFTELFSDSPAILCTICFAGAEHSFGRFALLFHTNILSSTAD